MRIYLVRHGETDANASRVVQVPAEPLSARGQAQARRLGERLAAEGIGGILASDLERAAMTARAVAEATGHAPRFEPLLHERNFGDLRGTPYAELDFDLFGAELAPPGGETWAMFNDRVARAWERMTRIAAETEGALAVITHGLVCRRLVEAHVDGPASEPGAWANTSVTILDGPDWRITRLACTAHLEGDAF